MTNPQHTDQPFVQQTAQWIVYTEPPFDLEPDSAKLRVCIQFTLNGVPQKTLMIPPPKAVLRALALFRAAALGRVYRGIYNGFMAIHNNEDVALELIKVIRHNNGDLEFGIDIGLSSRADIPALKEAIVMLPIGPGENELVPMLPDHAEQHAIDILRCVEETVSTIGLCQQVGPALKLSGDKAAFIAELLQDAKRQYWQKLEPPVL